MVISLYHSFCHKVKTVQKRKFQFRKSLQEYKDIMSNGVYSCYSDGILNVYSLTTLKSHLYNTFDIRNRFFQLIVYGLAINIGKYKNAGVSFDQMMISHNGNIKLINARLNILRTYFVIHKSYTLTVNYINNVISNYYPCLVKLISSEDQFVDEKYIPNGNYWYKKNENLEYVGKWVFNICFEYLNYCIMHSFVYFGSIKDIKKVLRKRKNTAKVNAFINRIYNDLLNIENLRIPVVFSHNDLHFENIIKDSDDKFYVIDYEYSGKNFYFIDSITWFLREAIYKGETKYLLRFMSGEYDQDLRRISDAVQWNSCLSKKELCFLYLFTKLMICENIENEEIKKIIDFYHYVKKI